jgi:hypothetical protein
MVAVLAADDAAHIDVGRADTVAALAQALDRGDAGQVLHIIVEVHDIELLELLLADRLDADRNVLQVFSHLLRGDHDLFEGTGIGLGRRVHHRSAGGEDRRDGGSERQLAQLTLEVA